MVIFHSYVSLPEGKTTNQVVLVVSRTAEKRQDDFRTAAHEEGAKA